MLRDPPQRRTARVTLQTRDPGWPRRRPGSRYHSFQDSPHELGRYDRHPQGQRCSTNGPATRLPYTGHHIALDRQKRSRGRGRPRPQDGLFTEQCARNRTAGGAIETKIGVASRKHLSPSPQYKPISSWNRVHDDLRGEVRDSGADPCNPTECSVRSCRSLLSSSLRRRRRC